MEVGGGWSVGVFSIELYYFVRKWLVLLSNIIKDFGLLLHITNSMKCERLSSKVSAVVRPLG